jgi:hypothetical protein
MSQSDAISRTAEPIERAEHPILAFAKKILLRVLLGLIVTFGVSFLLNASARLSRNGPPGFPAGMVHGILMPVALPALILGRDVVIYATPNAGRSYDIGYTLGVNGCGALFFGIFYWRLHRWGKRYGRT